MIKVNYGTVAISGASPVVCAEMEILIRQFKKMLEAKYGKERSEDIFNKIMEDSKKSDEQIEKETDELMYQAEDLLKDLDKILERLGR